MREMADSSRRRFFYRANTALQVAFPLFVILFAGVVLLTSLAIFVPLITLIQALK